MANIFWNVITNGDWTTADDWNTDISPGIGDDAVLGTTGFAINDPYAVSVTTTVDVDSITIGNTAATLAVVSPGTLTITTYLSDAGDIELQYGVATTVSGDFTNTGTVHLDTQTNYGLDPAGGSTLTIGGTLTNSGAINVGNGGLTSETEISAAALANTGVINLTGNTGAGDTKQAVLDIAAAAPTTWTGTISLAGQALLEFASGSIRGIAQGAEIYLGTNEGYIADAGTPTSNSALVALTVNAGDFELQYGPAVNLTGDLTNTGTLHVDTQTDYGDNPSGGSTLTMIGILDNSGTVDIGNGLLTGPTTVSAAGLVNTGTVVLYGNTGAGDTKQAVLDIAAAAPTTWTGSLSLYGQSLLEFGGGSIGTIAAGAQIYLATDEGYIADAGTIAANSALTGLTDIAGDFELQYGPTVDVSANLTNTGTLNVDTQTDYGDNPSGGSTLTIAGTLTNSGTVDIGNGQLTGPTTVSAAALDNTGTIILSGNAATGTTQQAALRIAAAAPTTWTSHLSLYGQSLLEFGGGSIGTIAAGADIYLSTDEGYVADSGATASNSALAGLTDIAGDFELQYGPTVTIAGNLTNTGTLNVDTQTNYGDTPSGGSTLTISGTLTNSGTIDIGNGLLTGPTTVSAGALVNTGIVSVNGNATAGTTKQAALEITDAAPIVWAGTLSLSGQSLVEFGSGSIGTIAAGAEIYLASSDGYIGDAGTTTSDSALIGLTSVAGDFSVEFGASATLTGDLAVTGFLGVDDHIIDGFDQSGGSTLVVDGTLTNSTTVTIGNGALTGPTLLSAGALVNTGTIAINGNGAAGTTDQAVLDVAAPAPTTWNGVLSLSGDALLEYGSGSIGTIAAGAEIYLAAADAYIADAGTTTSDSALTGLTDVAGNFSVEFGASVTLSADLAVTGFLGVDDHIIDGFDQSGGSTLVIDGTLTNSSTVTIGNGALTGPTLVSAAALVNTGTIAINGNGAAGTTDQATLKVAGAAPTIWNGVLSLSGDALLEYGSGSIGTIAAGAEIYLASSVSTIADAGATTSNSALTGLTDVAGNFSLEFGSAVTLSADLAVTGFLGVDDHIIDGFDQSGGSTLHIDGTLTNSGTVAIGNYNLLGPTTFTAGSIDNELGANFYAIGATGGSNAVTFTDSGTLTNAGAVNLVYDVIATVAALTNSGTFGVYGSAGGAATFSVNGAVTNAGTMTVGNYAEIGVTGAFTDSGTLTVGGVVDVAAGLEVTGAGSLVMQNGQIITPDAASLTIDAGGTVSGDGVLSLGVANSGGVTASGGLLDIAGPITGAGALGIASGSELELGAATAETVGFNGNVGTLKLDDAASFTGAITGLVEGDTIDLVGVGATAASVDNGTLIVTAGAQTYTYVVSGPGLATNSFALEPDRQGGADLVLGPPGPVISGPATQTAFLDFPSLFGPLTIADPDAGAGSLTVTITAGAGAVLTGAAANGGTLSGSGSNTVVLIGDLADINTMLAGITYLGATAGATDDVRVVVTDSSSGTAAQTVAVTTETVPFTAPLLNLPTVGALIAGTSTALNGLSVSDPYAQVTGEQLRLEILLNGTLTASGGSGATLTGQGTGDQTITGTVAQINSYLSDADAGATQATASIEVNALEQAALPTPQKLSLIRQQFTALDNAKSIAAEQYEINIIKNGLQKAGDLTSKVLDLYLNNPIFAKAVDTAIEILRAAAGLANIVTSDGLVYSLNAEGEFVLAESTQPSDSFLVEIRLQPVGGSASNSEITQVAAGVNGESVTFAVGRAVTVWIDGAPSTVGPAGPTVLAGGQITQPGPNTYVLTWTTGEVLTVVDEGAYLDATVQLPATEPPATIEGLIGPNGEGAASDFATPDGTVLPQPLTTAQLTAFAQDWEVTPLTTLFDYPNGDGTVDFTNNSFPTASITLADLPASVVALAAQAVAATGVTDPGTVAAAEYDFIASGGDPGVVTADEGAFQGETTTPASVTESAPPPTVLGVIAPVSAVQAALTGPTAVTFDIYLSAAESSATEVDYAVVASAAADFTAADFGGTLPSGKIIVAPGRTEGTITIDVPQGALGNLPSANVALQISTPDDVPIFAAASLEAVTAAQVTAPSGSTSGSGSGPTLMSATALPELEYLGTLGTFSQAGNAYTLDLGDIALGESLPALRFGIVNGAAVPGDALTGTVTWATVAGFDVAVDGNPVPGASVAAPIAAGSADTDFTVTTVQNKFGAQSEVITFTPVDTNSSGYSSQLAPVTLTIADTLDVPGTITSNAYGDVHILTYNGLHYDFQAAGEFILAESEIPGDTFQIQLRLQPYTESASVTLIQQVAILLGAGEDVTFSAAAVGQPPTILVNGAATSLSMVDPTLVLSGGTITEVSPDLYKVVWNTGESMTLTQTDLFQGFNFFNVTDSIPDAAEGTVMGLQGENEGTQNDFQLPDGTILQQPLSSAVLLGEYADAWRVSETGTLFSYGPGQSWQTFAHPVFPIDPLTLADIPASVVAQAAAVVAAAGITDPATAQDAELDYIVTGDPNVVAAEQNVQQEVTGTVAATVTPSTPPTTAIGVMAAQTSIVAAASGATAVTFTAYLTAAAATGAVVDYAVIDPNTGDIGSSAFSGGVFPTGAVTIAAGQTTAQFTIDVPQGALGAAPDENLAVQVGSPGSVVPVLAPTALTEIVNAQAEAGNLADPVLAYLGTVGAFSFDAQTDTYTLNLNGVPQDTAEFVAEFAVANAATAPSDDLGGTFTAPSGTGFTVTGAALTTPLAAGDVYQGLYATVKTADLGANTMSLTFDPVDENASGYSASLTPLTLNIVDTVTAPAQAIVNTPTTVIFPNVHVGGADSQHVSVGNTALAGSANLDVTLTASGDAVVAGTVSQLAPGATDASDLTLGIDTGAAGALSGAVTETFVSDGGGGATSSLASEDPNIDVFGDVYRLAAYGVPSGLDVHMGASGDQSLIITNTDPADTYSENLIATVVGTTGAVTATGATGDIAAQQSGTIAVDFATATAGSIGTVTLDLKSDGTGIDGLGMTDLGDVTIPVSVTGNNDAVAELVSSDGTLTEPTPDTYVLNLGTVVQNASPVAISLAALNAALAPADDLDGSYSISGDADFTNTGFGAFTGVAAGTESAANTVALDTGTTGSFSETITLAPTGSNSLGYSGSLSAETVTVTGTVAPPTGTASGDVHLMTFDGLDYDFQALGDFTLARSTVAGDSFLVQIHTTPFANIAGTSVVTEAAAQIGGDIVTFGMGSTVAINGIADTALSAAHPTQALDGGTLSMISATDYQLNWSSGETLTVDQGWAYLNVTAKLGAQDAPGSVQGLLGSDTGQAKDFALPDGTVLKPPLSNATLLGPFADAWTVAPGQSLLGGTVPAASGLGAAPAMTFLSASGPGQILTGSLQAGSQGGAPVTMVGALADFSGDTVTNFAAQDLIDVTNVGSALATVAYTGTATGGVLTIGAGSAGASLTLSGDLSGSVFHAVSDQHGGTLIGLAA